MGSLVEAIKIVHLRWFGHKKRMIDNKLLKKICKWIPKGQRQVERPELALDTGYSSKNENWRIGPGKIEMVGEKQ